MPAPDCVLALIGDTPMIELTAFDTGPCRLFLKLEMDNPGGSIKDRIALTMIEAAEKDGRLRPGMTLVEATAGNTGLGLALVGAAKGYPCFIVMPDKMSAEKRRHLEALGAEVHLARSDVTKGHPEYYQEVAERLAAERGDCWYVNQFENPDNVRAHEEGTAPEILAQMDGQVDAVVVGVGSGGTLSGLSRYFERESPDTELVLADPTGSILVDVVAGREPGELGSWQVEGIGEDFLPVILDMSRVEAAYSIDDAESFATGRALLQREGILGGSSTGTLLAAALRYCREQSEPKRVVTIAADTGNKYLSKFYNDDWMTEHGHPLDLEIP